MNRLFLVAGALCLALAMAALFWPAGNRAVPAAGLTFGAAQAQEASGEIDISGIEEMSLGAEDAPVTVIEYASFTCPHCARFHENQLKKLKADYVETGKVRFIYRDVFFDRYGLWASMVARCGGPERFFGISDLIYAQQSEWVGDGRDQVAIANNLRRIGKVAGLDEAQVEACLNDADKAQALVAWYQQNASADDVSSTPTLIIDGQKHGNLSYDELSNLIDGKLGE